MMQTSSGPHTSIDTTPSTSGFLQHVQIDPQATNYKVSNAVVSQLHRSLWTSILSQISPAYFLPREIAPTLIHALVFLERSEWKLCEAQKRATIELNERRRERLGGVASSASSSSSTSSSQNNRNLKGKFVPPRLATPPPGTSMNDDLGAEYGEERKGMPCGHVFRKGEAIYRCRYVIGVRAASYSHKLLD
jgi:E3 ubiquitin-protein ligase UBR1